MTKKHQILTNNRQIRDMTKKTPAMYNPNININPIHTSKKKKAPHPKKARKKKGPSPN
jgi:hypothetical protein